MRHPWLRCALMLLLGVLMGGRALAAAAPLPLNHLVEQARELDGREVTVQGEAVGEVMLRGAYGWVNLNDGTNTVGVWAPAPLLRRIEHTGRYGWTGDTVRVTGTFFRMDPAHGGELDIHARTLEIVRPGAPVPHPVAPARVAWAAVFTALGLLAGGLWWRRLRRATLRPERRGTDTPRPAR